MRGEGDLLAGDEGITPLVTFRIQWWSLKQSGKIESGQRIQDDDLVSSICVDGLVEGEIGRCVVESEIQGGRSCWEGVC